MVDRTKLRAFGNQGTCRFTFRFRSPIRGRDCQGSFFRRPTILSAHSTGRARSGTRPPRGPSRSATMTEVIRRKESPTPRCPHISWNSTVRWATNVTGSSYTCPERPWGQRRYLREQSRVQKIRDCFGGAGCNLLPPHFFATGAIRRSSSKKLKMNTTLSRRASAGVSAGAAATANRSPSGWRSKDRRRGRV